MNNENSVGLLVLVVIHLVMLLKVEFLPKFSVRGIWQRWRESYPTNGNRAGDAITAFTGVSLVHSYALYLQ